jgi:zinc transporter
VKSYAFIDNGQAVREATPEEAALACRASQLVWIHLDVTDPATRPFLAERIGLPELVVSALTAVETRPRCEPIGEGALINLRGLALHDEETVDELVSIRVWTSRGLIVSVARYTISAMPRLVAAMQAHKVKDPGDFVALLGDGITDDLDPDVAELGDRLDQCELNLDANRAFQLRRSIAKVRAQAIEYRRFVAPQRQALERLAALHCNWLEEDDRLHLAESADRFARMTEELESIRERAALMHEQITDMRAEVIDQRALIVSVVALVFLPLTFLTGLFGMNVKLPYQDAPWAFWAMLGFCAFVVIAGLGYFLKARWFR